MEYYDDWHKCTSPHLLDSLHWLDPAKQFPDKITKKGEYFITTSRYGNWTNNPAIYKKQFYLDIVTPLNSDGINLEKKYCRMVASSKFYNCPWRRFIFS